MKIPEWADELITEACRFERKKRPDRVIWKKKKSGGYSGTTKFLYGRFQEIIIRDDGTQPRQIMRMVVLHELAHYFLPPREYHSKKFWKKAIKLYIRFGIPELVITANEGQYRKTALNVYSKYKSQENNKLVETLTKKFYDIVDPS